MSRLSALLGFVLPVALMAVNLYFGYGGILALVFLMLWLGVAVFFMLPEEPTGA